MSEANVGLLLSSVCPNEELVVDGVEVMVRAENLKSEPAAGLRPEAMILIWGIMTLKRNRCIAQKSNCVNFR